MQRSEVLEIVYKVITEMNEEREVQLELSEDTILFGQDSTLDSLGLVNLIVGVEQLIAEAGIEISVTDDRTMSQARSPFRSVQSLVDYVHPLVGSA